MTQFTMPSLGADMAEGVLREWLVAPGDRVRKGDVVAVVETDKAAIEVECFESGTLGRLLVPPGTRVPVGTPLAVIEPEGTDVTRAGAPGAPVTAAAGREHPEHRRKADRETEPTRHPAHGESRKTPATLTAEPPRAPARGEAATPTPTQPAPRRQPPEAPEPEPTRHPAHGESRETPAQHPTPGPGAPAHPPSEPALRAGPLVRHLAVSRGVDLAALHGTGRGGRVTRADVEHAPPPRAPRVRATPYARRLARELGVDLTAVAGTGDGGAVRAGDVHAAVRARAHPDELERPVPQRPDGGRRTATGRQADAARRTDAMRRAIADLMSRSKREIPHYYLSSTVDLTAAADWLRRVNRGRPPAGRLVPAALLLKAAAAAAREVPDVNGHWRDDGFVPASGVHLGVAVSLRQGGLLAPVIHDADSLPPDDLMERLRDLVQRARRGRLRGSETSGATLTVTNLGDQGVESVYGVIHPPQVALVGFGAVVERPWASGGMLGVRPVVTATLAADHRATDGAVGARYLTAVGRLLQKPEEL